METQKLEYVERRSVDPLTATFDTVDSRASCSDILGRIEQNKERTERDHEMLSEWSNCVWLTELKEIGPYPKADWQPFLNAYGVRDNILSTERE